MLADEGSFEPGRAACDRSTRSGSSTSSPTPSGWRPSRRRADRPDAIVTGAASIDGERVALAVMDFGFLGGSMGSVVGEEIARAAERAADEDRALVMVAASGGARMQEGALSLMQMAKTTVALEGSRRAGCRTCRS
jgi:acetyl-CoA carboxylase carboxyl transferase subunit beta